MPLSKSGAKVLILTTYRTHVFFFYPFISAVSPVFGVSLSRNARVVGRILFGNTNARVQISEFRQDTLYHIDYEYGIHRIISVGKI